MISEEKAINALRKIQVQKKLTKEQHEAIELAAHFISKYASRKTKTKPNYFWTTRIGAITDAIYICPYCGKTLGYFDESCDDCGQLLDWSEWE